MNAARDTSALDDLPEETRVAHVLKEMRDVPRIDDEVYLSQKSAAKRLGVSINTFKNIVILHGVSTYRFGVRCVRYQWGEIKQKILGIAGDGEEE